MEQIYYGLAIVSYGIFIIRFILSWIGGDFELDSDADLDISDVVSFKGLTHFVMGFSGWMSIKSLASGVQWYDYILAIIIGFIFIGVLFFVYKLMCRLESKPIIYSGRNLIAHSATVYMICGKEGDFYKYIIMTGNGIGTIELNAKSIKEYKVGDISTIVDYDGAYYIIN